MYIYKELPYNFLYECKLEKKDTTKVQFYILTNKEASIENMHEFIMMIEEVVNSKIDGSTSYTGLDYHQVNKSLVEIENKLLFTDE